MQIKQYYEQYWSAPRHSELTPGLARLLEAHVQAGWKCLDMGCGDGRTAGPWIQQRGCTYTGVDISANAVTAAREIGLDVRQIEDISELPFPDGTFDAVVCVEVMEHLFEPHAAAAEALRVLKPGGVLIVTVPNVAYWRRRLDLLLFGRWNPLGDNFSVEQPWRDPHIRFFNTGALRRMLVSAGFAPVAVGGHAGGLVKDIPVIGWRLGIRESSAAYRLLERCWPSMFSYRLHAVAFKPLPR